MNVSTDEEEMKMNRAQKRSRARLGGLLALALGVAALLAIPVVSVARDGGADDGAHHGEKRHHHHRHHRDREVSGTIAAFDADSGRLTIETRSGDSVSGLVDSTTRIKCEDRGEAGRHHKRGEDRRGRSGEAEPGDDHGGRGEAEPGDDHGGGDNSGPGSGSSGPRGHHDNGTGANCTTAALVSGAVVREADLEIEHGSSHFDEVELAR
ncbi:MAG: hypothetical protein ACOYD4_13530 [Solirubrobacterales bacterium]